MKPSLKIALNSFVILFACGFGAAAFYTTLYSLDLLPDVVAPPPVVTKQAISVASTASGPVAAGASLSEGEELVEYAVRTVFLYVHASSTVSGADGAITTLEVVGAGSDCGGQLVPAQLASRNWSAGEAGGGKVSAKWCLPVKPNSQFAFRSVSADWEVAGQPVDTDYSVSYLRYISEDGTPSAVKVTALASCDDDKGCGYLASITAAADDKKVEDWLTQGDAELVTIRVKADEADLVQQDIPSLSSMSPGYRRPRLSWGQKAR